MTQFKRPATTLTRSDLGPEISFGKPAGGWRLQLFKVVFESDTRAGKIFDVVVIAAILLSVVAVMTDSVESVATRYGALLDVLEWMFTILFTIEYVARLLSVERPLRYATSFFG